MRITLLNYVETPAETSNSPEVDRSIEQIDEALRALGHKTSLVNVHKDVDQFIGDLRESRPELVFNLLEQFGEGMLGLVEATALVELLGFKYTGSGPGALYLQEDKALTKKLLAYEKVNTPDFAVFSPLADLETGGNLRMPLFVKPLRMDASFGIEASRSLVATTADLMRQVKSIHEKFNDSALCEQYIEGREFYVGVLGNQTPQAFPPIEIDFSGLPDGAPHVMDGKAKFAEGTPEFEGTEAIVADIEPQLAARLQEVALSCFRALRLRDYGRVDLRLTPSGDIYVIEVNANCYLEASSEFAMGAAAVGLDHRALVEKVVALAIERTGSASPARRRQKSKTSAKQPSKS